jgi:hypothetical protein
MNDKIKLLFVSASPAYLRSDRELREIEERIRSAPYGSAFEVASAWAVQPKDITDALLRHMPQILHFSGHGEQGVGIFLEDERRARLPVSGQLMCSLLEPLRGTVRVVILNACETRTVAEALQHLVDYTISMRRPITDHAAIVFASAFYGALAHRQNVRVAFHLAVTQLGLYQIPEADIPDLVERPGITQPDLLPLPTEEPLRERSKPLDHSGPVTQSFNFVQSPVGTFENRVGTVENHHVGKKKR